MISAIILLPEPTPGATSALRPDQLARTFSALVPAVIEGLITSVLVLGRTIEGAHRDVADHAGCDIVEGLGEAEGVREALTRSGRPYVLVLKAPYVPEDGFIEEVGWLLRETTPATLLLRERPARLFSRAVVGVLAPRATFAGLPRTDFAALARIRPARALKARARRVN